MPEAGPQRADRYEEVRRKLRERGYLDGPLERFVLKDLPSRRSLLLTSFKAALLGGPILGGLVAGAAVAANRPLLGATDGLVLWLYFSMLGGVALFLLDLGVAAVLAAVAMHRGARPGDRLRASLLVGLPTLVYLLLLWWSRHPGGGLLPDGLFLLAALGTTLLVAWLGGLVSLAGIIGRTGQVPDRGRRVLLRLVLLLLPLAAALLLLRAVAGSRDHTPVEASPFLPAPVGDRLLLVGVDGLDASLVEALEARGAVGGLLAAMTRGAVFPKRRPEGAEPAEVWTTILTGMPASAHGVRSAGGERVPGVATPLRGGKGGPFAIEAALRLLLPGRTVPTSGTGRRVRTLWEIAALKAPVAAVGWWACWPAEEADAPAGYVVTDRVLPKLLARRQTDRDTAPASVFGRLEGGFEADRSALRDEFEARFRETLGTELGRMLWESFLIDAYNWKVLEVLMEDPSLRAAFVYLPGLDILRRRALAGADPREAAVLLATQQALEDYARWLDGRLAEALAPAAGWRKLLVADPGRETSREAEGFVVALGGPSIGGCVGPVLDDLDIAPLALYFLGFPRSAEMQGSRPLGCLLEQREVPAEVATYGRRGISASPTESEYDPEMVERLRSLGYLR